MTFHIVDTTSIVVDNRQRSELSTRVFVVIGYHIRMAIRTM